MSLSKFTRGFLPVTRRGSQRSIFDLMDRDMMSMMRPLQSMFENLPTSTSESGGFVSPSVDVKETDKAYELVAEMPGLKRENVDIELDEENRMVTLKGESSSEKEEKDENYVYRERSFGKFMRSFPVPEDAKMDDIKAVMRDGLLKLEIPKGGQPKKKYQPKKISVMSSEDVETSKPSEKST